MDWVPPERWQEVEVLFGEVADLPTAERAALLDARSIDPAVRADLDRLLAAHDRANGFLDALDATQAAALLGPDVAPDEGRRIGPYHVLRPLGRGGMGVVYLAHDPRLDRRVALKLLPPHISGQESARRRLVKEAKAASALDHANIATIYEIGETESGQLFIAMAYYEGDTLREQIEKGPLPTGEVHAITEQIAEGLAAAHRRGIVHRDIKPANVIVTPEGVAKIVDFGVARGTGDDLTREGSTLGTVAYMSPEQTRGSAVDHRADLWSLGVVTYEMLTGVRPFEADSEDLAVVRIRRDVPVPITHLRPDAPVALVRMVEGCLSKRPDARFASARDVLVTLRTAAPNTRGVGAGAEREGLVVLPFVNISPDPANEYFSDGLTEEVITDLSHIRALRVISRTSAMRLKGSDKDVRTIAHELGVRYVLEGSVRKAGDALRISAQLIDAHRDVHLWARKIDGTLSDVFKIQEEVARAIVEALRIHLTPGEAQALADRPIPDARAFESYLRARFEAWRFSSEGLERARRHIETALEIVGDNELLYSTLGHITVMYLEAGIDPDPSALERVEALAEKVFALNPEAARGHWLKAFAALQRGDIGQATLAGERALALAPDDPDTLILLGYVYVHVARNAEALALFERAIEIDPLTPLTQVMPGFVAHLEGRFADAVEPYRRCHEMDPDSPFGAVLHGWMLMWNREFEEALSVLEAAAVRFSGTAFGSLAQSAVHALRGEFEEAVEAVTPAFEAAARGSEMFARELANCYALAGAKEKALDWLEHAVALGMLNYPYLAKHNWLYYGLHDEPRFEQLMDRVLEARAQLPTAGPGRMS
jgi:serine/threonine protein kinase/Tfp pilus assembly protein PilF